MSLEPKHIKALKPYVAGKSKKQFVREFGERNLVKLASNENPLGCSPKAIERVMKLVKDKILNEKKNISALSLYWTYLLIVWIAFFLMIYIFNDSFIEWCKSLIS